MKKSDKVDFPINQFNYDIGFRHAISEVEKTILKEMLLIKRLHRGEKQDTIIRSLDRVLKETKAIELAHDEKMSKLYDECDYQNGKYQRKTGEGES